MIAAEDAAVRDDRMQRQEAAIQKWRSAPAESGMPHSSSLGSICAAPVLSLADIEAALRREAGYARLPSG